MLGDKSKYFPMVHKDFPSVVYCYILINLYHELQSILMYDASSHEKSKILIILNFFTGIFRKS